jgi:hypothetical protein
LTIPYSGIETLALVGLEGDNQFLVFDSSAGTVRLDGGRDSDSYDIITGVTSPMIVIHDSGPLPEDNGGTDTLLVPTGVIPTRNIPFNIAGKTVLYDHTIEQADFSAITPILNLQLTGDPDFIRLDGTTLQINNSFFDMTFVEELTIDSLGGDDTFIVVSVLSTLTVVDFRGGADNDSIFGPDTNSTWTLTGMGTGA